MPVPPTQSTLQRNLQAIASVNPELAQRICAPFVDDHIKTNANGETLYFYGRVPRVLNLKENELPNAEQFGQSECELVIAGIGLGEAVSTALEACHSTVHAWERDPALVRRALTDHDWASHIHSGRLVLYLGVDCVHIPHAAKQVLWAHPVLESIYSIDMPLLRTTLRGKRALICAGELFVKDIAEALEEQGFSVYTWDIKGLAVAELERTVRVFQPEVAFAINFSTGLSEACHKLGLPLAIWEIDPNTGFLPPCEQPQPNTHIFTYRKTRVPLFKRAGFPNSIAMPLAANTDRRRPQELNPKNLQRFRAPISFVGASMVSTAIAFQARFQDLIERCYPNAKTDTAHGLQEEILAAQRTDFSRWQIPDLLEARAPGFRAMCQKMDLDDPSIVLGEMSASEKRLSCVAQLGHLGIHAWGDSGWKHAERYGVKHRGYAGHFKELNYIYSLSQVNVDVGRIYQSDIVPMRIFDILSCGGFVLAEYTPALEELFVLGEELVVWRDQADLQQKAAYYLDHPQIARSIALAGRARVCRDHRIKDRIHEMLEVVSRANPKPKALSLAG